jgi:DNA replication protein DnaC
MERLNDIMMRSVQRRQDVQGQRPPRQGESAEGQRPQSALPQRPSSLPEQTTRPGRQRQPGLPQSGYTGRQQRQPLNSQGASTRGEQNSGRYPSTQRQPPYDQVQHLRDIDQRGSVLYQRPQSAAQEPSYFADKGEERPEGGEYYDDYAGMPPADIQEDWEEDEEEEEDMRYGDWENAGHGAERGDVRRDARAGFTPAHDDTWPAPRPAPRPASIPPAGSGSLHAREGLGRQPIVRGPRDVHTTQAQPFEAEGLPAPPALPREAQRYQRNTQPLNPGAIAGVNTHPPQERLRQAMASKQARQQQVTAAVPAPTAARSSCPKCQGAGYLRIDVPYGHPNFGRPVACECKEAERREKRRQDLLELSDLSAFQHKIFKNFNTRFSGMHPSVQEAYQEAYRFAHDLDGWLVLVGPNGCGKTHLAAAIANYNLSRGSVVLFTVVPDLLAHLRSTFGPNSTEAYDQRFAKMREAELLVLDDLGAHQSSSWASEKLFQLLNYRYNVGFPTVVTANKQGLASMDERIMSRLSDTGLVTAVVMNGALDYRRQNTRRAY